MSSLSQKAVIKMTLKRNRRLSFEAPVMILGCLLDPELAYRLA